GAQLEFVLARRAPEKPGRGVVFLAPLKGKAQQKAAAKAGFIRTNSLHSVRVEGPDKPGLGAQMTEAMAAAGVNLRGFSACCIGRRFIAYLALDDVDEARNAVRALKRIA
ncbi:MAG: ACT domain-containing protein, partial [Verrucomicrobiota bacterium]